MFSGFMGSPKNQYEEEKYERKKEATATNTFDQSFGIYLQLFTKLVAWLVAELLIQT